MIGALYRCASFGIAPIWSRWPCEQTIAFTVPSTVCRTVSSGIALILIRSRECISSTSASSWIISWSSRSPMSKMTISFPQRTAVMFRPTSSYPPTAIISISIGVVSPECCRYILLLLPVCVIPGFSRVGIVRIELWNRSEPLSSPESSRAIARICSCASPSRNLSGSGRGTILS